MKNNRILQSIKLLIMLIITIAFSASLGIYKDDIINTNEYDIPSYKTLDANAITAWFRNNGSFNHNYINNGPGFQSGQFFLRYISGIWIGAKVLNDTLISKSDYTYGFQPGYTDNYGVPQGKDDTLYRVFKLTYGVNDDDRLKWPNELLGNSNQGAPVYFDSVSNTWKPFDYGHQTMFYAFTDSYGSSKRSFITSSLKADIKMISYAFNVNGPLGQAIFSHIKVINRSNNVWNNAYISVWTDDNIGSPIDDKIGSDSALQIGYTYNENNNDPEYGPAPPAVGFVMLKGADEYTGNPLDTVFICEDRVLKFKLKYKNKRMTVFNGGTSVDFNPANNVEVYRLISGLNQDGTPMYHPLGYVTKFKVSQNSGDQKFLISTGPVNINPGDTQNIVMAQLVARGSSNLNSVAILRTYGALLNNIYYDCFSTIPIGIEPVSNEVPSQYMLYQNYPNPFNPTTHFGFRIADFGLVQLVIYDITGREIAILVNEELNPGIYEAEWDATNYSSGVYYYKLITDDYSETKKMVLIR